MTPVLAPATALELIKADKAADTVSVLTEHDTEETSTDAVPLTTITPATTLPITASNLLESIVSNPPPKFTHSKFGVLSTTADENAKFMNTDFIITFRNTPLLDRNTSSKSYTIIGQVMYNGGDVLQEIEACGSTTGEPRKFDSQNNPISIKIIDCGRLPAMSKAIEVNENEVLDVNGKNINQVIS